MNDSQWVPRSTPLDKSSPARIYDYWLGGYHNFEVDRKRAQVILGLCPDVVLAARVNRAFLRRAVRFCVEQGMEQFLDLGSGIPTIGNVHEIAQQLNPATRIVYVDVDRVAVEHSKAILRDNPRACAIEANVEDTGKILDSPELKHMIDWSQPAAILFLTVLHYIVDDDVASRTVRTLRNVLAPGSYIAISHVTYDGVPPETRLGYEKLYRNTSVPNAIRTQAEIQRFFEGFELVEPGLVHTPLWRPEGPDDVLLNEPGRALALAGIGRKID